MKVQCRKFQADKWADVSDEVLIYYWETTDIDEIAKCFKYLGKRILQKMNLKFKLVK